MQVNKDITNRIYKEVKDTWLMQLATVQDSQPWIANVFFVVDAQLNFYWLSYPNRRHSRELALNPKAAIAIAIKTNKPVIGVQAEGEVAEVHNKTIIAKMMLPYIKKYGQGKDFLQFVKEGKNKHILYKFSPTTLQLFDEVHYKPEQNPIQLTFID